MPHPIFGLLFWYSYKKAILLDFSSKENQGYNDEVCG